MSEITIIIPIFNAEKTLEKCVFSIFDQTFKNYNVIFIDDGSTDKSSNIYLHFVENDKRFSVYFQENKGPSAARNLGLKMSLSPYVVFIDSDDYLNKNYLEYLYRGMVKNKSDLICSGYYEIDKNERQIAVNDYKMFSKVNITKEEFIRSLFKGTSGVLWTKMFKRKIIIENNITFDERVKMSEDLIFNLKYVMFCSKITILNNFLYYYNRFDANGISSNQNIDYLRYVNITNDVIEKTFLKFNITVLDIESIKYQRIWNLLKSIIFNSTLNELKILYSDKYINSNLQFLIANNKLDNLILKLFKKQKLNLLFLLIFPLKLKRYYK